MKRIFFFLITLMLTGMKPSGRENYSITAYHVTIHGTSNLHDWDETVGRVSGTGTINGNADGTFDVEAINIKMEVRSIKSDHAVMNNKTYDALKADANPYIYFSLTSPLKSVKSNESVAAASGNLTIAGVTRPVSMQVKISMPGQGSFTFEGSQVIRMSDYHVDPPTALFGALKTGNEITLYFKTNFSIQN